MDSLISNYDIIIYNVLLYNMIFNFLKKTYLREKERGGEKDRKKEGEKVIAHPLIDFPNSAVAPGWNMKSGTGN